MQFVNKVQHVVGVCFWYVLSEVVNGASQHIILATTTH